MAISPREAAELSDVERQAVAALEQEIDEFLRREYVPGIGRISMQIHPYQERILATIVRRYQEAGWYDVEPGKSGRSHIITFDAGVDGDAAATAGFPRLPQKGC